jgi:hypothetical protein
VLEHGIRRRLQACACQTLKVVFAHRLHLGWRGPDAAKFLSSCESRWKPGREGN